MRRPGVVVMLVAAMVFGTGAAAWAISDGVYSFERQHCTGDAANSDVPSHVEPGCQTATANLSDGAGNEAFAGIQQSADGTEPSTPIYGLPTGLDPTTGLHLYFGADDNLDNGEHDSSPLISNGPSDGGAVALNVDPASLDAWVAAAQGANVAYLLTHPVPVLDAGTGACADGICVAITTLERLAYAGGDHSKPDQPVSDYSGKNWDPDSCGGPSDTPADCGGQPGGILFWHNQDGNRTTEPGVQVFEDPDPQGSPLGPYPLPALYLGTCGLIVGGGPSAAVADSPLTNTAHQLQINTGC